MNAFRVVLFVLPFIVSFGVSLALGVFGLRKPETNGARAFGAAMVFQALWVAGYGLELAAPSLGLKLVFDDMQWFFSLGWATASLAMMSAYTGRDWQDKGWFRTVVSTGPAIFLILVLSNPLHGVIRTSAEIVPADPFPILEYPITLAMQAVTAYLVGLYVVSVVLVTMYARRQHRLFRYQSLIIFIGTLVPVIGGVASIADVRLGPYRDLSPFTFTVSALVIGFGLFRYRLFTVRPVAREAVFESVVDPILVFDPNMRLMDVNERASQFLGSPVNDLLGSTADEILESYPGLLGLLEPGVNDQWSFRDETIGIARHFDVTVRHIRSNRDVEYGTLLMLHEFTEVRRAREQLRAAQQELARRERFSAVGKLLSKVAHDLRTPMGALRASLYAIRETTSPINEDVARSAIARAEAMVDRLESMTDGLLDFEREAPMVKSRISLRSWVDELIREYRPPEDVRVSGEVSADCSFRADPEGLRRALINLLSNACEATAASGRSDGQVTLSVCARDGEIHFEVVDTGVGIPEEELDKIFEPLFTTKPTGMGLGMPIVRDVADAHGGRLEVDSKQNAGTTARLVIPLEATEARL